MESTKSPTRLDVHIRWMIRRDMERVLEIESGAFEFPWTEEDFASCLCRSNCIGMVAERGEQVLGFMVYELHETRIHLLSFAVSTECHSRGVGSQLLDKMKSKLARQRRTRITLEVRESNVDAQLFFKSQGFRATSVLRDFYDDSPEDAYLMQFYV